MGLPGLLKDWLRVATDVRREEIVPAALMFVYGFLALSSYYIAKAVRNAVFVQRVGADNLPYVYIMTAIFVTLVMVVYSRFVDRVKQTTLLQCTFAFMIGSLLLFWWLLRGESATVTSGAFYIFIKLYGLLVVSQFWLVANVLFTTSQARRLFGPIGVGLILGGIFGGAVADGAVSMLGSENLLLGAALTLVPSSGVVAYLGPRIRQGEAASGRLMDDITADAVKLLRESSHLRTVAWILGLTITASTLIDWELNKAVELFVVGEDQMTAFWGRFFVLQNLASVLIQVLFTSWILQTLGVGAGLMALPLGLLVASVGVVAVPALLTAALAKGTEGALRYSLDQSTRELLYLPVPTQVKYKVKPLIDLAVYRGGTGLAGVLLLVCTAWLGFSIREVGLLCIAVIGVWGFFALRMRSEFRDSVKRMIGIRDVELDELIVRRLDALTVDELREALRSGNERRAVYALSLLEHDPRPEIAQDVRPLVDHESADVRVRALRYLVAFGSRHPEEQMAELREAPPRELETAVLAYLLRHGTEERRQEALDVLRKMASREDPEERLTAARLLSEAPGEVVEPQGILTDLLNDEVAEVRARAMHTAGELSHQPAVPVLLERLRRPEDRRAALDALEAFGPAIEAQLLRRLSDPESPFSIRRRIPGLLRAHARQETVDRLVEIQGALESNRIRYEVVKVLDKLRRNRPELDFERYDIQPLVELETREAYRWFALWQGMEGAGSQEQDEGARRTGDRLLLHLLEQRYREAVERALRTFALAYPLEDLYAAHSALSSPERTSREQGFELLENVLSISHRRLLAPLLNPGQPLERKMELAADRYGFEWSGPPEVLRELAADRDPWVAGLAHRCRDRPSEEGARPWEASLRSEAATTGARVRTSSEEMDLMNILDTAELLQSVDLFSGLRTEDLAALAALAEEERYAAGQSIFEEGAVDPGLHIILEGEVVTRREGGAEHRHGVGEPIGEIEVLGGIPARYSAVAAAETVTLRLSRGDLLAALEERFGLVRSVLARLARRYEELEEGVRGG